MTYLMELREKRQRVILESRALLDKGKTEKRNLSAEEQGKYDELFAEQGKLQEQITREERQVELDREVAAESVRAEPERKIETPEKPKSAEEVRSLAFRKYCQYGRDSLDMNEVRALQVTPDSYGGYLVPPVQWVEQLIKSVDDNVFIRRLATKFQVSQAQEMGAPSLENDPADADWTTELLIGSEDSTMSFGVRNLHPHPVAKLLKVSDKLLRANTMGAENLVRDRLAYKFSITEEKAYLTGSGANQPLGVMTASANGISTGRDVSTGNSSTAIGADNLREVKYSIKGNYWPRLAWIFHRSAVKQISKLKDGDGQYLWQAGITNGDPDRILGFPVYMSEYQSSTFTTGLYVGILGDFSNYWIADALDMRVQRLVELYAATNQVGFIGRKETDGMPVLEEAFARVKLA